LSNQTFKVKITNILQVSIAYNQNFRKEKPDMISLT